MLDFSGRVHRPFSMSCAVSSSKMAIMERLLVAGNLSQNVTGLFDHQKLVSQYIHRVLCEADEANLLDEKDMHVFGLKPMEDPICLVCCNSCKKPINVSQYKAHAGLCMSLITPELLSELDSAAGKKKLLKKERKKAVTARRQRSSTWVQESPKIVIASHPAASDYSLAEKNEKMPPLLPDSQDGQRCANFASTHSNCATRPRTGKPAAAAIPPSKRSKLTGADIQPTSDGTGTVHDVSKTFSRSTHLAYPVAPLATKIYYSRNNNYLHSALGRMYHGTADEDCIGHEPNHNACDGYLISSQCTSTKIISDEQTGSPLVEVRGEAETAESCIFSHSAPEHPSKPV